MLEVNDLPSLIANEVTLATEEPERQDRCSVYYIPDLCIQYNIILLWQKVESLWITEIFKQLKSK